MNDNPKNETEMEDLLAYQTQDLCGLDRAIAVRAWHWALSGLIAPGKRREAEIGRRLEFVCRMGPIAKAWRLARCPSSSASKLEGSRLKPDTPGVYVVESEICGYARAIEVVAVPPELLTKIGPADGLNVPQKVVRGRINDGSWTTEALIAALESNPPAWGRLASPA